FLGQVLAAQDSKTAPAPQVSDCRRVQNIKAPERDESSKDVELAYFFWYGCATCAAIDEKVSAMAASLPEGITFKRLPAAFLGNQELTSHAKLFWALESLGQEGRLHSKIFSAVLPGGSQGPVQLVSPASQEAFAAANQIPAKDFTAALESFYVRKMLAKTYDYLNGIELDSVPTFVVNGMYRVTIDPSHTEDTFINVAYQLAVDVLKAQEAAPPEAPAAEPPAPASPAAPVV
ncbi:MAG: hypothetical protein LBK52_01145, partial [Deltaproteobacteria bacterium]|nr:hypothetical protein [Deltaproteobacteria bacterium]